MSEPPENSACYKRVAEQHTDAEQLTVVRPMLASMARVQMLYYLRSTLDQARLH